MNEFDDIFSTQPEPKLEKDLTPFDREAWMAQKQKEKSDAYALIDSTVLEMAKDGGKFQKYLDVQSRFDRYSVGNAVLIAAQKPEASRLEDFDGWKKADAYVKKGEAGITLLEPGEEYTRADGSVKVPINTKKVFDISQTNAKPAPAPQVSRDSRLLLKALINNAPCKISISDKLPEHVNAVYQPEEKAILVRQGMNAPDIFRALAQELVHARMDKGNYTRTDCAFNAYCAAYMLCRRNNIAADIFRFDRLPEAYASMDAKGIRGELGKIRDAANEISADMARILDPQRQTKHRDDGAR